MLFKAIAATDANAESSRSHVIVQVIVMGKNKLTQQITTGNPFSIPKMWIGAGYLNLVDLAGSERVSQTNATGQLLKEAQAINKSLSELGNVVLALRQNQRHIPFRNCQLTRILEDSLSKSADNKRQKLLDGDSKTFVIVHLSPESKHITESISSMNFAEKIGCIQTK